MEGHGRHCTIGRRFGVGIVGLGEGKGLVKGLHGHPDLPVLAVCDLSPQLVARVGNQFGIPGRYTDLAAMLRHPEIEIVVIYTPDQLHLEHIRQSLAAGKHVICTKPLVTSLDEAREVIRLTEQYPHLRLMVGQSSRFFEPFIRQRAAFESGQLGELSFAEAHYIHDMRWFYANRAWAREGGFDLIFACCSHPVDMIRWYMGDAEEVFAYSHRSLTGQRAGFAGSDTFVISLKFRSGRVGRVLGWYGLEQPHQSRSWIECTVSGTEGTYIAKYPQLESTIKLKGEPERVEHHFESIYHHFQYEGVNHHAGEFVNYTEHFARCLVDGTVPQPDARDGFKTMATLEAIRESIRTGLPVKVAHL